MATKSTPETVHPMMVRGIDRVLTVQRPAVLAHLRMLRRARPAATPEQLIATLERRYLAAVTTGGAAVGATAAVPAIGTGTSLALSGVETAGFLEVSALYAQSVAEVHGIAVHDQDRARTLVMTLVLGNAGTELLQQLAGQVTGTGPARTAYWGELVTKSLPRAAMGPIADRIKQTFLKRFAVSQGTNIVGRMIPFGIGAIIGGGGNLLLGRQVVRTAREGFGPAPATFPEWLEPTIGLPKSPREPKPPREPKVKKQRALKEIVSAPGQRRSTKKRTSAWPERPQLAPLADPPADAAPEATAHRGDPA